MSVHATVWFDGASKGNPGPAGGGAVVDAAGRRHVVRVRMGIATNNEAEYRGFIAGVEKAKALGATKLTVHGDSQLILRQLEGRYQVKAPNLRPLYEEARRAMTGFESVRFEWVRREQNADADRAANEAISA